MAQGSLTPPAAPAPTMKTLDQIEPRIPISAATTPGDGQDNFIISKPGSYYLTNNLISSAAKGGIRIETNNVTLDLNGFAMDGSGVGSQGIRIATILRRLNIIVRNGTVCNWTSDGVSLLFALNARVEKIMASGNGGNGIETGENGVVKDCGAFTNGFAAAGTFLSGIAVGENSTVENCVAEFNGVNNANCFGIATSAASVISHCSVSQNNGPSGVGISTGAFCQISDCTAALANGTNSTGISLGTGSSAVHCVVAQYTGAGSIGISAAQHGSVENCLANLNGGDGIQASDNCTLTGNKCDSNGGYGLHTTGMRNRIDGNMVALNTAGGIKVDAGLNLVVRNTATGSSVQNYVIAAGNSDAERINGSTGFTSTDPWLNFSF